MTGAERRENIIKQMQGNKTPISGQKLAESFGVSRQVIVQDIALIRASGHDIISTNRGYILNAPQTVSRIYHVFHSDEMLEAELCGIVDLGGCVENVMVEHEVYGHLEAELNLNSRRKVKEFVNEISSGKSSPLKRLTSDYHAHTITADSDATLDLIEQMLKDKGILL